MLLFDIGANRGEAAWAGVQRGFDRVVAVEAAPRIFRVLAQSTLYSPIVPLRAAVSDFDGEQVEFYEAEEDGLSSLNKAWLTDPDFPYAGKPYRTVTVTTVTIDALAAKYGDPDLIKIDVEGAEWKVLQGMNRKYGTLCFEWTDVTLAEHEQQLAYLANLGYTEVAPQFIVQHLQEPPEWFPIGTNLSEWVDTHRTDWETAGWKAAGLRPTADVGMVWVR